MGAFNKAASEVKPSPFLMFDDVYNTDTAHLAEQRQELREHLQKYGENYSLDEYEK